MNQLALSITQANASSGLSVSSLKKNLQVIMVGPALEVKGGISFVEREYLEAGLGRFVSVTFIPTFAGGSLASKFWVYVKALARLVFLLPSASGAIVHLHVSQKGSFLRKYIIFLLAKFMGRKTIVHLHGSQFKEFMHSHSFVTRQTKALFDGADAVLVLSELWKKIMTEFSSNPNIVTLYNPIRLKERRRSPRTSQMPERPRLPAVESLPVASRGLVSMMALRERLGIREIRVLFLGRLGERKGTFDLLKAIRDYAPAFRQARVSFILAGDGEVERARNFIWQNDLHDLADVPGWISGPDKEEFLESSDILILPSYNEQMPMSILEAMAYGYPIIATRVAGIPEMVEEGGNGFLFEPGDIPAMGKALMRLCSDAALRQTMGARSRQIVKEKFQTENILEQLVGVYESV